MGFQCPDCVASARAELRASRPDLGRNPAWTSIVLIGLNVAVWAGILVTGGRLSPLFALFGLTPQGLCRRGGTYYSGTREACVLNQGTWELGLFDGAWWQLLTSAFTHLDATHIAFNMLALWVLGPQLERLLGRGRFLVLYVVSALSGSVVAALLSSPTTTTVGASGAIFGLMGGLLIAAWRLRGNVQSVLLWLGANVVITVLGYGSISWQGHLGGLLGGLAVAALFFARRRP